MSSASEVIDDGLNEGCLDVLWIGDGELFPPLLCVECYGCVVEYGEADHAFVAYDFDAVGTC